MPTAPSPISPTTFATPPPDRSNPRGKPLASHPRGKPLDGLVDVDAGERQQRQRRRGHPVVDITLDVGRHSS